MKSFKETIKELNAKIQYLQDNNCKLVKDKEILADENCKLTVTNDKLEKELCEKTARLVVYNFYIIFITYCLYFVLYWFLNF